LRHNLCSVSSPVNLFYKVNHAEAIINPDSPNAHPYAPYALTRARV